MQYKRSTRVYTCSLLITLILFEQRKGSSIARKTQKNSAGAKTIVRQVYPFEQRPFEGLL